MIQYSRNWDVFYLKYAKVCTSCSVAGNELTLYEGLINKWTASLSLWFPLSWYQVLSLCVQWGEGFWNLNTGEQRQQERPSVDKVRGRTGFLYIFPAVTGCRIITPSIVFESTKTFVLTQNPGILWITTNENKWQCLVHKKKKKAGFQKLELSQYSYIEKQVTIFYHILYLLFSFNPHPLKYGNKYVT